MRLSPPPKVVSADGRRADAGGRRGVAFWVTAVVFLLLGAVAVGVFALLPGWVEQRSAVAADTGDPDSTPTAGPVAAAPPTGTPTGAQTGTRTGARTEAPAAGPRAIARPAPGRTDPDPPLSRSRAGGAGPEERAAAPPTVGGSPTGAASAGRARAPEPTRSSPAAPRDPAFARAMAAALEALDCGELARARSAFEEAAALSPGSEAAADGLARVEAAEQLEAIAAHRRRAESLEAEEDWEAAVGEYDAVLALDPAIRFAVLGRERAGARRALARDLDRHLSRPDRLAADEVLEEARELVERARRITPPGPRLAEAIGKLEEQIAVASTPVRVVLLSDGLTEVLVYRVGRLGTFERRELDLRPGRYTVVGARAGFRDVRHELEVSPGGGAGPLTVRCEEGV